MASIDKLGEGRGYKVRWREGKRARSKTVATFAEARTLRAGIEGGEAEPSRTAKAPPWEVVIVAYLGELAVSAGAVTVETRAIQLARFARWAEAEGLTSPCELRTASIAAFHAWLSSTPSARGRPRTASTVKAAMQAVELFTLWLVGAAVDFGWSTPIGVRRLRLPRVVAPMVRAAQLPEVEAMIAALGARRIAAPGPAAQAAYRLAVVQRWTGARIGEVIAATWGDMDLTAGDWRISTSKTGHGRMVPLSAELRASLATWRADPASPILGEVITTSPLIRRFLQAWAESDAAPEIYTQRPTHAIRRAVRSHLAAHGVADELANVLLGHGRGVVGRYEDTRSLWPRLVAAVELLGAPVSWAVSREGTTGR
ncbi:site-specific integrase [Myxococcota bacterium]|nr:site-specific integrase [Myxococcota bacterium]